MQLGRVVGCVWATVKDPELEGLRMLIVQPVSVELKASGKQLICTDCTGARTGDIIYWVRSKEATMPFLPAQPPTDATIVGIVERLNVQGSPA